MADPPDIIWGAAKRLKRSEFSDESTPIEDDHLSFLEAGVPAVDLIDLEYYTRTGSVAWHTREDTSCGETDCELLINTVHLHA